MTIQFHSILNKIHGTNFPELSYFIAASLIRGGFPFYIGSSAIPSGVDYIERKTKLVRILGRLFKTKVPAMFKVTTGDLIYSEQLTQKNASFIHLV